MPYKDPEKQKAYMSLWKQLNRDHCNKYQREYRKKQKLKSKAGEFTIREILVFKEEEILK